MSATLTTGELARRGQTTLRTIRYYEAQGLLPSHRTEGGHRVFGEDALLRLQLIKDLRSLDFTLDQIRVLLDNWARARLADRQGIEDRREVLVEMAQTLESKLRRAEERVRTLQRVQNEFFSALQVLRGCGPCGESPGGPVCPTCHNVLSRPPSGLIDVLYELHSEPHGREPSGSSK